VVLLGKRDANRKPVLQLVDADGRTHGYLKVGWNEATRGLVSHEVTVLEALGTGAPTPGLPEVPELVTSHEDSGLCAALTRPMPSDLRKWPNRRPMPVEATRAVGAALAPPGEVEWQPLASLSLWARQEAELRSLLGSGAPSDEAAALLGWLTATRDASSGEDVPVGGWHGDWAPWNLATSDRTCAWDWEHAGRDVPLGFDALHWRLSVLSEVEGEGLTGAAHRLGAEASAVLAPFEVPSRAARTVAGAYLVERWLREHRLAGGEQLDRRTDGLVAGVLSLRP